MSQLTHTHPDTNELAAFGLGRLDEELSTIIEEHLAECDDCRQVLDAVPGDSFVSLLQTTTVPGRRSEPLLALHAGYEILGELGRGGMGVVYKARQRALNRLVALKVIHAGADPAARVRFRREAEAAARLQHPHVVRVYDVGEQDGQNYLAMELVEGGSLAQRLATAPLLPQDAAKLVEMLARAVQDAHAHGIVHRDLKPANVLLASAGRKSPGSSAYQHFEEPGGVSPPLARCVPKIADFGLARCLDQSVAQTTSGAILGTPSYMAPEQAAGRAHDAGPAADIYALGAILYETLTGRPPFRGATALETVRQVTLDEPVPPRRIQPLVPRDLDIICLKCLEKEPARRYASALALADDLRRFLDGQPIQARLAGWLDRLLKASRRNPALTGLIALAAVAVTGLVIGVFVHNARLRAEIDRADANATRADRQKEQAEANYHQARATIHRMLDRIQGPRLVDVPRLRELQREQLEDALGFYEGLFQEADDNNHAIRRDLAQALREAAFLQTQLGRGDAAANHLRRAICLGEQVAVDYPDDPNPVAELAQCYSMLGNTLMSVQRRDEVKTAFEHVIVLYERLVQAHPNEARYQMGLAQGHNNLGSYYALTRDGEAKALEQYRRSATIRERLLAADPDKADNRKWLAQVYVNLANASTPGDPVTAAALFEKVDAVLQPGLRQHPGDLDYPTTLAAAYINWGNLLHGVKKTSDAYARYAEAQRLLEDLLRREPSWHQARYFLYITHGARAVALDTDRRYADAVGDWNRAVDLSPSDGERLRNRHLRAWSLARAGLHARATAEARALAERPGVPADQVYELACISSVSIQSARADETLTSDERTSVAERYATQALRFLRQAEALGFFQVAVHLEDLKKESDLDAVRTHADYRALETELRAQLHR